MAEEIYLGDGAYASFDGFQIKLRAPREHGDDEVYIEPSALKELRSLVDNYDPTPANDGREWPQAESE